MTTMRIKDLSEQEFAEAFAEILKQVKEDPIKNFVQAANLIDFTPTAAQMVALKCVFGQALDPFTKHAVRVERTMDDVFDLVDVQMTEVELYLYMTGFAYSDGQPLKNRINFIVGRRAGKSTLAAILALYSMIKINWKPFLSKTPFATVIVLSHSVEFSEEIIDILKGMVDTSPILKRLRDPSKKNTTRVFHLKVPFLIERRGKQVIQYSTVRVKVGAASKKTTRGSAVCTLLCDEIAFWNLAENAAESDVDILRAVRPALAQFGEHGMIIKMSSPGIKQGVLYNEWQDREKLQTDFIQFKSPSWVWNNILPESEFIKEFRADPEGFDTEFRANFVDAISNFISPEFVDLAVQKGTSFIPPIGEKNVTYTAAIDAAFKSDRFAFTIVGSNGTRITQYVLKYWKGTRKEPVEPHEVAKYIKTMSMQYGFADVAADQYAFEPLRAIFAEYGIRLVENPFTNVYKRKIYYGLKRLINAQQLDLLDDPILTSEIKELQVEQTATGQIKISHPPGKHDDCVTALAIATYVALGKEGSSGIAPAEVATGAAYGIIRDVHGRAFSAPSVDMLEDFVGFKNVTDNSSEYTKHPETGKLVKVVDLEEESGMGNAGADFLF